MTDSPLIGKTGAGTDWDRGDSSARRMADLREIISRFAKNTEGMTEFAFEGNSPVIIKRTEANDTIIEISAAFKSGLGSDTFGVGGRENIILSERRFEKIKAFFRDMDAPAVTTEELSESIGCPPTEVVEYLTDLENKGVIEHRQSGHATIWWPAEDESEIEDQKDLDIFPKYIREGLEQSENDIEDWIRENQRGDETMEETYTRIRGNPAPEDIRELVTSSGFDTERFREVINSKEKSTEESKEELRNIFE